MTTLPRSAAASIFFFQLGSSESFPNKRRSLFRSWDFDSDIFGERSTSVTRILKLRLAPSAPYCGVLLAVCGAVAKDAGLSACESGARERLGEDVGVIRLGRALDRHDGAVLLGLPNH
jgi:hypothetical protein